MNTRGKFIQTVDYADHLYGLTREAVEEVAREGLACCVHMELEGVLSLKNSHFEPRYILLIPTQVDKYVDHLKSRNIYSPAQIDRAVSRIEFAGEIELDTTSGSAVHSGSEQELCHTASVDLMQCQCDYGHQKRHFN
ncbi:hypothetical protein WMY93_010550 [Mugilogobius chulae]|uniref:Guanylate kinase-like domain-containing protein n=1 Tax=Mugilogobius chulae TaxID=88201 RepID=A0AAW0PAY6_9GOBI